MNYCLKYDFDKVNCCGKIHFNDKNVIMDFEDIFSIINFDKNFIYYNDDKLYPYYLRHNQKISFLDFIFKYDDSNIKYIFKNNNPFDLRRKNIKIYHEEHAKIINNFNVIDYELGHYLEYGVDSYIMKNPIWKIKEKEKEYLLMYCEKDTICKLCPESYQKIIDYENEKNNGKKLTWYKHQNGYIMGNNNLYIHQIIMNCYGNGKGTNNISVDHIDQDPLNNTLDNLRTADRKQQEQNSKGIKPGTKRERKYNAKDLPEGITQDMLKKYVVYYQEWLDKEHTKQREFFKVEKHPKLDKPWASTKSGNVSIQEKLNQANKVVDDLDLDVYPNKVESNLPPYVSLITFREKPHLVFEKTMHDKRLNLKMVLPTEYDLQEQLEKLNEKINDKYGKKELLKIFKYKLEVKLDNSLKYIKNITFDISRYHKNTHTLFFESFVTEKKAVLEVEKWLTEKASIDYCESVKNDLFAKDYTCYGTEPMKGALLGDCIFLEEIIKIHSCHIQISCGS